MKITYVCADHGIPLRGHKGASFHVRAISAALQRRGHTVTLICAREGQGNARPSVANVIVEPTDEGLMNRVIDSLRSGRADVVIERYSLESDGIGSLAREHGVAHVLEVNAPIVLEAAEHRGLEDVEARLRHERLVFEAAGAVLTVSAPLARYVQGVAPRAGVVVVPNGVDVDAFACVRPANLDLPAGAVAVGFVGSMKSWHGVEDLIEAMTTVERRHPTACLVLAGDGPVAGAVRGRLAQTGLGKKARWLGAINHDAVPAVLAAIDIAVAPYRPSPTFYFSPLKVLEYMAAGRPTVFPRLGELPALVGPGGIGYQPGTQEALAKAICRLLEDPGLRHAMGAEGRRRAADRSWDAVAARVEDLATQQFAVASAVTAVSGSVPRP